MSNMPELQVPYRLAAEDVALAIKADAEIARLTGENAVLRDLLRYCWNVLDLCYGERAEHSVVLENLQNRIVRAINGHGAEVSDGQIYEAASRRANPKAHADFDRRLSMVLSHKPRDAK